MNDQYTFFDLTLRAIDKIIGRTADKYVDFGSPTTRCFTFDRKTTYIENIGR